MIWIEFMGPAGVGKSYYYNKIIALDKTLSPESIITESYLNNNKSSLTGKLLKTVYVSNFKNNAISQKIIAELKSKTPINFSNSESSHIEVFLSGLATYDASPVNQLRLADFYHQKIKEFKFYKETLGENDYFLSEDGIMHLNFGVFSNVEGVRFPDLIVNFDASDSFILKNRMERASKGEGNLIEKMTAADKLESYILDYNQVYRKKVERLKKMNIDFFDIRTDADSTDIQMLIEKIQSAKKK